MDSKTDKNGVKVDIFVPDRDGFFVPLSTLCEHLEEKKQRLIRKKQITKQRLAILTRMVKNSRYEQVRFGVTLLLYLISLGCFFHPSRQVQKTAVGVATTTIVVSEMIGFSLKRDYRKLQKQNAYWKQQEQSLERS